MLTAPAPAHKRTGMLRAACRQNRRLTRCPLQTMLCDSRPSWMPMERLFLVTASLLALIAVGMGALGAHALKGHVAAQALATFEVAVRYQMYHALALLAVACVHARWPSRLVRAAGWCFIAGTLVFCGSLYLLVLFGASALGAITPLGGVALLAGWACLALGVWKGNPPTDRR